MKKTISIISTFFLFSSLSFSQLTVISTGTNSVIRQLSIIENYIVVSGQNNYTAKSYDECNNLIPLTVAGPSDYYNYYLNRMDTNNFFILSTNTNTYNFKIYKTSDGGYSWELKFDTTGMFLNTLIFFDTLEGIATGTSYNSIRTQDGGNTWTTESFPLIIASAIEVFGDSTVCVGISEKFRISYDRGNSWTGSMFVQSDPRDFFFLNKDTLFATSYGVTGSYFSRSFDKGATWLHYPFQYGIEPYSIYFKSTVEGYIVGRDQLNNNYGIILKTTDLGQSWSVLNTQITTLLIDIGFLNDSVALITGTGGVLLKWNSKTFSTNISEIPVPYYNVTIKPNPTTDKITVNSSSTIGLIEIHTIFGQQIHQSTNPPITNASITIDLSSQPNGIYFLMANINAQPHTMKIIKM